MKNGRADYRNSLFSLVAYHHSDWKSKKRRAYLSAVPQVPYILLSARNAADTNYQTTRFADYSDACEDGKEDCSGLLRQVSRLLQ